MNDSCHICGESDNLVPVTIKDETIYLCSECKEAHLKQCSQCDDFFIDTENDYAVSRDGDIYCEFCRDEYLTYCEHCDEYSDSEDFVHLVNTDEWWCRSCAERDAYQCVDCFDWVTENHGDSNHILCSDCLESHYAYCDDCGDLVNLDELSIPARNLLEQLTNLGMKKFTRREVMERTGWTKTRLHIHLQELMDMELVILESGKKNTVQTYKLLYDGDLSSRKFFLGLKPAETVDTAENQ